MGTHLPLHRRLGSWKGRLAPGRPSRLRHPAGLDDPQPGEHVGVDHSSVGAPLLVGPRDRSGGCAVHLNGKHLDRPDAASIYVCPASDR